MYRSFFASVAFLIIASPAMTDEKVRATKSFVEFARENTVTRGGSWLEMQNVFGDWEKVILVFGFAHPEDHAACQSILEFAASQNPARRYRCNPVD